MIDVFSLATSGLAFFVVAVTPGPANISNATIAMSRGRKTSLIYATGLSCGLVFWGLIAASGMGAVLQSSRYLLTLLKILGGLYLLWLAALSIRAARRSEQTDMAVSTGERRFRGWFLKGLLLNISNPKSVIAWMAALSLGVNANDGIPALIGATVVCICVSFANNAMYSVLFSFSGMMRWYQQYRRWIDGAAGAFFAVAGLGLLRTAFSR